MTNSERAEKIVTQFNSDGVCLSNTEEIHLQGLITSQLDEAVTEAIKESNKSQCDHGFSEGFASAKKKAAGIADLHSSQSFGYSKEIREAMKDLAERIRAMESGEK